MATVKYTGARYITKFADPIEWQSNTAYEQIVACTYQGKSYISKQPVPKSVGNPAANPAYWLLWADPSAEMETLRQWVQDTTDDMVETVETFNDRIQANTDSTNNIISGYSNKLLWIGDSFSTRNNAVVPNTVANALKLSLDSKAISGTGFLRNIDGETFKTQAQAFVNEYSNGKEVVDTIVIYGGWNDRESDFTEVRTAMRSTLSLLNASFPRAKKYMIGPNTGQMARLVDVDAGYYISRIARQFAIACAEFGFTYIPAFTWLLGFEGNSTYWTSDGTHPSETGLKFNASFIIEALTSNVRLLNKPFKIPLTYTSIVKDTSTDVAGELSFGNGTSFIVNSNKLRITATITGFNTYYANQNTNTCRIKIPLGWRTYIPWTNVVCRNGFASIPDNAEYITIVRENTSSNVVNINFEMDLIAADIGN